MPFNCEPFLLDKCHGSCCGIVPIPLATWQVSQAHLQRPVLEVRRDQQGNLLPVTADGFCCFLGADLRCAIYPADGRPDCRDAVCRDFGSECHVLMSCAWQTATGKRRSRLERRQLRRAQEDAQKDTLRRLRRQAGPGGRKA